MVDLLKKIDLNRTLLRENGQLVDEEQKQVDRYYRIHNTCTSNAIEGNTFTPIETELWLEEGITVAGKTRNEVNEVDGHGDAFNLMLSIARGNSLDDISERLLPIAQELHETFYKLIDWNYAGVYRRHNIIIANSRFPTPKLNMLIGLMDEFRSSFIQNKENLHPVILAAYAHQRLVQIHPFCDGNGRTSRLLMNLILVNQGYQIINIPLKMRDKYYMALRTADNQGLEVNAFFHFIVRRELAAQKHYMKLIQFSPPNQDAPVTPDGRADPEP
jgi:Fic family protein